MPKFITVYSLEFYSVSILIYLNVRSADSSRQKKVAIMMFHKLPL